MAVLVTSMAGMLDARMTFRLSIIMAGGMMLADDRRVAFSWFMAGGVRDDWDRFYDCLISVERETRFLALPLLIAVVRKFTLGPDGHMTAAVDVREKDVPALKEKYGWKFRTKLALAVDLPTWFMKSVHSLGVESCIRLVTDGAYVGRPVLKPLTDLGVVAFSRLRKDACLFDLPPSFQTGSLGNSFLTELEWYKAPSTHDRRRRFFPSAAHIETETNRSHEPFVWKTMHVREALWLKPAICRGIPGHICKCCRTQRKTEC